MKHSNRADFQSNPTPSFTSWVSVLQRSEIADIKGQMSEYLTDVCRILVKQRALECYDWKADWRTESMGTRRMASSLISSIVAHYDTIYQYGNEVIENSKT